LTSVSKGCLEERHQDTEVATVGPFYLPIVTPGVGPISMPISTRARRAPGLPPFTLSRDHRSDCKQVVLALIVTRDGFPWLS
jgi:hypothetical protein